MDYKVIEVEEDKAEFESAVFLEIQNGWRPLGGVSVGVLIVGRHQDPNVFVYHQAMIKED